jgi:hypothetical protein
MGNGSVNTFPCNESTQNNIGTVGNGLLVGGTCRGVMRKTAEATKSDKIGTICPANLVLTEDLVCSVKGRIFNNTLYVRDVHLTKGQAYS